MKQHNNSSCLKLLSIVEQASPFDGLKKFLDEEAAIPQICNPKLMNRLAYLTTQAINKDCLGTQDVYILQLILQTLQHLAGFDEYPQGLQVLLDYGLTNMIKLLEKSLVQILTDERNEAFDGLYEILLETIVACAEYSEIVRIVMLQQFLDRLLQVVISNFRFTVKFETIKSVNLMLEVCPGEVKTSLTKSKHHCQLMGELAKLIPTSGDYECQVAMTECLCRLTLKSQRNSFSKTWFAESTLRKEFLKVRDSHFEEDCRCFLNTINHAKFGQQSVLSFPCCRTFLGNYEIFMPDDPDCSKFWVDFNLTSHRITMFCQQEPAADQEEDDDNLWQTVSIWEENVLSYTVQENDKRVLLQIQTRENCKELIGFGPHFIDHTVFIEFDVDCPIREAAEKTFHSEKYRNKIMKKQPKVSVSIFCEPNSKEDPKCADSVNQTAEASGRVIEKTQKKPKVSVPHILRTPARTNCSAKTDLKNHKSKEATTPGKCHIKPKRVKTPLQMVDSPSVSSKYMPEHRKPKSSKISVAVVDSYRHEQESLHSNCSKAYKNLCQDRESAKSTLSDENIVPSSAPEEQMLTVPDSQPSYLQNLRALGGKTQLSDSTRNVNDSGVSLDTTDETIEGLSSSSEKMNLFKNELQKMDSDFSTYPKNCHKVSSTPCLSTVSEESAPGSSKFSSQHSFKQKLDTIDEAKGSLESEFVVPDIQEPKSRKKLSSRTASIQKQKEKPVCASPDSTSADIICSGVASQDLFITQQDRSYSEDTSNDKEAVSRVDQKGSGQRMTRSKRNRSNKNEDRGIEGTAGSKVSKIRGNKSKKNRDQVENSVVTEGDDETTSNIDHSSSNGNINSTVYNITVSTDDGFVKPLPVLPRSKNGSSNKEEKTVKGKVRKTKSKNLDEQLEITQASCQSIIKTKILDSHETAGDSTSDSHESVNIENGEFIKPHEFVKPLPVSASASSVNEANDNDTSQIASVYNFSQESLYSTYSQDACLLTRNKFSGINLSLDREQSKLSLRNVSSGQSLAVKPRFFKARAKDRLDVVSQGEIGINVEKSKRENTESLKQSKFDKSGTKPKSGRRPSKTKLIKQQKGRKLANPPKLSKLCGNLKESMSEQFKADIRSAFGFDESNSCQSPIQPGPTTVTTPAQSDIIAPNKSPKLSARTSKPKSKKKKTVSPVHRFEENSEDLHIEDSENTEKGFTNNLDDGTLADVSSNACEVISDFAKVCQDIINESSIDRGNRSKRIHKKVNYKDPLESDLEPDVTEEKFQKPVKCELEARKKSRKGRRNIFSDTGDDTLETRSEVSWICSSSTKKKPKTDKTYCGKPHPRETLSGRTAHENGAESDSSEEENYTEEPQKPPPVQHRKKKKHLMSKDPIQHEASAIDQQDSLNLFADVPVKRKQEVLRVKPQEQPKKKRQRSNSVKEKAKEKQILPEDASDETLIVEDKNKMSKGQLKHKKSSNQSELEQTIHELCTASAQALANLGDHEKSKKSKKAKKATSCIVNEMYSEDFATELRCLFDKAISGNNIVEMPETRILDVKKRDEQSKKTPNQQVNAKKYKKLDVQIIKTPVINSLYNGLVEDELETCRFEENLYGMDTVTISPIMPICQSTNVKIHMKESDKQLTSSNLRKEIIAIENLPETSLPEEDLPEENLHLSQNSNFSHISSLKTPKTPFTSREVEIAETEDQYNALYKDLKSGYCKRKKRRTCCDSQESNITTEEIEEEVLETELRERAASKTLKPRKLFSSYLEDCCQPESEAESEEEEEEKVQDQVCETSFFRPDYTEDEDSSIHSNVKSLIQTFGTDIQRNLMAKTKCIENLTKVSLKVTQKQVGKTWNGQNLRRRGILEEFKKTLGKELKLLEEDVLSIKQAESKVLECFRTTLGVIQANRQEQENRLDHLAKAHEEFEEEMASVEDVVESEKVSLQDAMRKEMLNLQKKILFQSQQQEISNVKRSLSAMFL